MHVWGNHDAPTPFPLKNEHLVTIRTLLGSGASLGVFPEHITHDVSIGPKAERASEGVWKTRRK